MNPKLIPKGQDGLLAKIKAGANTVKSGVQNGLNAAGDAYSKVSDFMNKNMTLNLTDPETGRPYYQDVNTPATIETTPNKQLSQAGAIMAAGSLPVSAALGGATGLTSAVTGLATGAAGSHLGAKTGQGIGKVLDLNENATKLLSDVGSIAGGFGGGIAGAKGVPALNNYGKYHGFGNQKLNNLFDRVTARTFTEGDFGKYIAGGGESQVYMDPGNSRFLLKNTEPLTTGTIYSRNPTSVGIDYATKFNAPGDIVEPIRYAGKFRRKDGSYRLIFRQQKVTPFSEANIPSAKMRAAYYNATEGRPEVERYFTDEALGKFGKEDGYGRLTWDPKNAPFGSDIRESNIGFNAKGKPVIYDYVPSRKGVAGSMQTFENADLVHKATTSGGSYFIEPGGQITSSAPKTPSMQFDQPVYNNAL